MPTASQRLSQMLGQPVEINLKEGETLEQAEERVISENPSEFGGSDNEDLVDGAAGYKPSAYVNALFEEAQRFPVGSVQRNRAEQIINAQVNREIKMNPTPKPKALSELPRGEREDLNALRDILKILPEYAEKKNSGFGGEGIDTGPIAGGSLGQYLPSWLMSEQSGKFIPSGVSEWWNSDKGEGADDRSELRQLEKLLFNPIKKDISGTAVSDQERFVDLMPSIPSEADNDKAFFSKTAQSMTQAAEKIKTILDTAKRSGVDVSGFEEFLNMDSGRLVEDLNRKLSQNPRGSFAREFPDKFKKMSSQNKQPQNDEVIDLSKFRR